MIASPDTLDRTVNFLRNTVYLLMNTVHLPINTVHLPIHTIHLPVTTVHLLNTYSAFSSKFNVPEELLQLAKLSDASLLPSA